MEDDRDKWEVEQFVLDEIDSVPHLEALLLLWSRRSQEWSLEELAKALYLAPERTRSIVMDLERQGFITANAEDRFQYRSTPRDNTIDKLDQVYRRQVVHISTIIHSKPAASLREFARAFRLKKDN